MRTLWLWMGEWWKLHRARRVLGTADDPRLDIDRRPTTSEGFHED